MFRWHSVATGYPRQQFKVDLYLIMKKTLNIALLVMLISLAPPFAAANDRFSIFVSNEFNNTDSISSVGVSGILSAYNTDFKSEIITSLNSVNVINQFGYEEEYLGLDLGMRFGYFNDLFLYVEGGLDIFEAIFKSNADEPLLDPFDEYGSNTLDGYASIGGGVQAGNLRIEGFVKARQINAEYWEARENVFYGVQFSVVF